MPSGVGIWLQAVFIMGGHEDLFSIAGIVNAGFQLATALQTYTEATQEAKDRLFDLVADVNSTALTLKQLQDVLLADQDRDSFETRAILTTEGREEVTTLISQCDKLYTTVIVLLTKAGATGRKGKVTFASIESKSIKFSHIVRDPKWRWLHPRIKRCQEQLRWLKTSLLLNLQLANLARFQIRFADNASRLYAFANCVKHDSKGFRQLRGGMGHEIRG